MESYSKQFYIRELCERNTRTVAVLGNGIVSNIATKILQDSIVLTKRKTDLFLNNIFFHDTIENRLMLLLFGIEFVSKDIPVSYFDNYTGQIHIDATETIRTQIAREKMGNLNKPVVLSTMTDKKPQFKNLLFDETALQIKLLSNTDVITLYPEKIEEHEDHVRLFFDDDEYIDFKYLINTIPQPFFSKLINSEEEYQFNPLVFVTTRCNEEDSMIYSFNNCIWKRKFVKNKNLCIEFNKEDFNEDTFKHMFPEIKDYIINEVPYGRISSKEVPDTKRIKHIGRFAQWDHSITTEHAISKLINLNLV